VTAGRRFRATCARCKQEVEFVTTGYPYGPLVEAERHDGPDGKLCADPPVLFKTEIVKVEPMKTPTTLLLYLDSVYEKVKP
jgi:hypothetical protein